MIFKFHVRFHYTNGKLAIGDSKTKLLFYMLVNITYLKIEIF